MSDLQTDIETVANGFGCGHTTAEQDAALESVEQAARLVANPNIEATARLLADHRGVDWADEEYMDACRRMAEQYVAAAFTSQGDTDGTS